MLKEKYVLVTNIFFLADKNILILKGLDEECNLGTLEYPLFINDLFVINISFTSEFFIERKRELIDERAFESKHNLDLLKGVDLALNVLRLNIR